jgi:hypothetical protein
MRPTRTGGLFGSGGFLPSRAVAAKLAIGLVAGSVVVALLGEAGTWLLLVPDLFLTQFALWQPLSYVFVERHPFGVLFGALITWSIGSALEQSWGPRRLVMFAVGTTVAAGFLTAALALLLPAIRLYPFAGGTVLTTIIWVAYGLSFGRAKVNFWGLPLTGNMFAGLGVGFVLLNAVFARTVLPFIPELLGVLAALGYVRLGSPRVLWLRLHSWRLNRQMKARAKHLKLVSKNRNTSGDSDRFLH